MCFFKKKTPQKSTAVFTLYKIQQLLQKQTIMNIECKKPNYCVENSKTYKLCDYKKKMKKEIQTKCSKMVFFHKIFFWY